MPLPRRLGPGILRSSVVLLLAVASCSRKGENKAQPVAESPSAKPAVAAAASALPSASTTAGNAGSPSGSRCPEGMAFVPSGKFKMGAANAWPIQGETAEYAIANEQPQHPASVDAFCLDIVPVTVADYRACLTRGACTFQSKLSTCALDDAFARHPVTCVTQTEAAGFCATRGARLPTESEWEYAARGGDDGRVYPWGNTPRPSEASKPPRVCMQMSLPARPTCAVGAHPEGKSPFGISDMIGTVEQWTSSAFCQYPSHDCTDPDRAVVVRSSAGATDQDRVTSRSRVLPTEVDSTRGFRCAARPL